MDNIEYVKSNVILTSYSSSINFKGFFDNKINCNNEEYVRSLLDIIFLFVDKLQVVSSVHIRTDLRKHARMYRLNKVKKKCRNFLFGHDVIVRKKRRQPKDAFHFSKSVDEYAALNMILYRTYITMNIGHLFFIDRDKGVIIYPHDGGGLGFIIEDEKHDLKLIRDKMIKYKDIITLENLRF